MRVLECYNNILIELNKVLAPSLLLDDFVYLFNKGIQEYINERYNLFETKQQLTDDLRVLLKSEVIDMSNAISNYGIYGKDYPCKLPFDYMHLLNCVCEFKPRFDCCKRNSTIHQGANKINANQWPHIINNYYTKPSVKNPYYYIMNVDEPSNVDPSKGTLSGRSTKKEKQNAASQDIRYGNTVQPIMRIVYGNDESAALKKVYIDYLRAPIYYSLSWEDIDAVEDNTQVIEFPDYVIYEIINRIVRLILENGSNPRIQTHTAANQSIV